MRGGSDHPLCEGGTGELCLQTCPAQTISSQTCVEGLHDVQELERGLVMQGETDERMVHTVIGICQVQPENCKIFMVGVGLGED